MSPDVQRSAAEPFYIRPSTDTDVDAIARIWHVGWQDGHTGHVPPELVRYRGLEQFHTRARTRLAETWVADADGRVVGFTVVKVDEVEQLYVDRAARGTGVAAMLIHKAQAEIRAAGHRRAWLAVVAGNQRARAFYVRQGWRDAGPMEYFAETDVGVLAVPTHRYEIDLESP